MELKLQCNCGQKYKFDVEPLNGRMPFTVACPICGIDGTSAANGALAQMFPQPVRPAALAVSAPAASPPPLPVSAPPSAPAAPRAAVPRPAPARKGGWPQFNWGLGILGAFLGAFIGAVLLIAFVFFFHFRFPFTGLILGALTGGGARLFFRGVHGTLGLIAAILTALTVFGCFLLFYGFPGVFLSLGNVISLFVSIGVAYRLASE
jgi:hypothetical protein